MGERKFYYSEGNPTPLKGKGMYLGVVRAVEPDWHSMAGLLATVDFRLSESSYEELIVVAKGAWAAAMGEADDYKEAQDE